MADFADWAVVMASAAPAQRRRDCFSTSPVQAVWTTCLAAALAPAAPAAAAAWQRTTFWMAPPTVEAPRRC